MVPRSASWWGAVAVGHAAKADNLFSSSGGRSAFASQTRVLDTRAAQQYASSTRLTPNKGKIPTSGIPTFNGKYKGQYLALAKAAAQRHGIPQDLFLRLVQQESGWNPRARSHCRCDRVGPIDAVHRAQAGCQSA